MFQDEEGKTAKELVQMAIGAARVGEYGRAQDHLQRAYRKAPHDVQVLFWQAMVAEETSQAILYLQRAARFAPRHPIIRRELWSRRLGRLPDSPDQPAAPRSIARLTREWAALERRHALVPPQLLGPALSTLTVLVLFVGLAWLLANRGSADPLGSNLPVQEAAIGAEPESDLPGGRAAEPSASDQPRIREMPTELGSEEAGNAVYTVQEGDSLQSIATRYQVTVEALMRENNLRDHWIYPGQELIIPSTSIATGE